MLISEVQVSGRKSLTHHLWGKCRATFWTVLSGDSIRTMVWSPKGLGMRIAPADTNKEVVL